jgi:hypothetical protein
MTFSQTVTYLWLGQGLLGFASMGRRQGSTGTKSNQVTSHMNAKTYGFYTITGISGYFSSTGGTNTVESRPYYFYIRFTNTCAV